MSSDIAVMIRKELKELFVSGTQASKGRQHPLLLLAVLGILVPWRAGGKMFFTGAFLLYAVLPVFSMAAVVADTFAGERERHTLEKLLASRMPDRAILLGKVLGCLIYAWVISLGCFLVAMVTVSVVHGPAAFGDFSGLWIVLCAQPLLGALMAGIGVHVSMKSETVRQTQQLLVIGTSAAVAVVVLGLSALPQEVKGWFLAQSDSLGGTGTAVLLAAVLILIDALLLVTAMLRFRRSELILD